MLHNICHKTVTTAVSSNTEAQVSIPILPITIDFYCLVGNVSVKALANWYDALLTIAEVTMAA